jgi:hypothetical protein
MLVWFLWRDIDSQSERHSAYFGLRDAEGKRKPSWYAFARLR